jgi:rhamnogalacturonan endolyase
MKSSARLLAVLALAAARPLSVLANVTITENADVFILDNGIVTAQVAKASGDLVSLRYKGTETLGTFLKPDGSPDLEKDPPGANPNGLNRGMTDHQYGFWSHDAMGARGSAPAIAQITIDPKSNGGVRGEVAVKGVSNGRRMGTGPGANQEGQFISDIEIRYALDRDGSGVYTYCAFEHKPGYGASALGEARFCAKLADTFDWMSIAPNRNKSYPKELREGDKYIYTVVQSENPAFGWSSTSRKIGFFILNPSMEYMSGGPTKVEFLGHRDTNAVAAPCVLNYWRSSHYGGARVDVVKDEPWTKVVGPFMLYVNSGANPQAIYDDAKAQQKKEAAKWPYNWVMGVDYPTAKERSMVKGEIALSDPQVRKTAFENLVVGLTHPAYTMSVTPPVGGRARGPARGDAAGSPAPAPATPLPPPQPTTITIDWQIDAKHYQFWTKGHSDGRFEIPHVRPGKYTLHAFADGVLGPFAKTDIVVEPGKRLDLGKLTWTPVRKGKPVWEIGIPNRNASEFAGGDKYWEPMAPLNYATLFPNDVNYIVGKSDFRKDWYFAHVPHNEDPNAKPGGFSGITSPGRATPFSVTFDLTSPPKGKATLRFAICGTATRTVDVTVNDQPAGQLTTVGGDSIIARHGIQGIWYEREVAFDAALLKSGTNVLKLTVPAGPINNGILYDYLRLEIDETGKTTLTTN